MFFLLTLIISHGASEDTPSQNNMYIDTPGLFTTEDKFIENC